MTESLPKFHYYEDPLGQGSVIASEETCFVCGRARGFVYDGGFHVGRHEHEGSFVCPWCIADGSAHDRYGLTFNEGPSRPARAALRPEVIVEVEGRTPGFMAWQWDEWWVHCDDAGVFLGRAGYEELVNRWPSAIAGIRESETWVKDEQWQRFLESLSLDGCAEAYVFRCRHCGKLGGHVQFD